MIMTETRGNKILNKGQNVTTTNAHKVFLRLYQRGMAFDFQI